MHHGAVSLPVSSLPAFRLVPPLLFPRHLSPLGTHPPPPRRRAVSQDTATPSPRGAIDGTDSMVFDEGRAEAIANIFDAMDANRDGQGMLRMCAGHCRQKVDACVLLRGWARRH